MPNINPRIAAVNAYEQYNKNTNQLGKDLQKVATGMKINSAADGASEYTISTRLRSLEGALAQDVENTKTGRNIIATAEGGIQEIISNLRDMKAMVINAMNDHNSDIDRETIQKDYSMRLETITDIAATTNYNGKYLLNGNYYSPSYMRYGAEGTAGTSAAGVAEVPVLSPNVLQGLFPSANASLWETQQPARSWAAGLSGYEASLDNNTNISSTTLDFSNANINGTPASVPEDFDQQGFTMACQYLGNCKEFVSIKFDASLPMGTGKLLTDPLNAATEEHHEYIVGIGGATTTKDIEMAVFEGVKNVTDSNGAWETNGSFSSNLAGSARDDVAVASVDSVHNVQFTKVGDEVVFSQMNWNLWIWNGVYTPDPPALDTNSTPGDNPVPNDPYSHLREDGNPLIIHHGPKQNQHLRVYINSMHPIALKINGTAVNPYEKAVEALNRVDFAIEYSLNEVTRMGAYQSQLEFTEDNLVGMSENTTAAKSVMQDTDMAKGMTDYNKTNVLAQASQSMLSQANQNMSRILDLLQ